MCGRFSLGSSSEAISRYFGFTQQLPLLPRYNIAPSQSVLAVKADNTPSMMHWGLIPAWAKDKNIGYKMINARSETLAEKPSFRTAYKSRRCLIPADGFYEWQRADHHKQPYLIRKADHEIFTFAGLWESWTDKQTGTELESCTIITTQANELLKPVHDRMPVIIQKQDYDRWLSAPQETVSDLLAPCYWTNFEMFPVSRYVNNARNEGPECQKEIELG